MAPPTETRHAGAAARRTRQDEPPPTGRWVWIDALPAAARRRVDRVLFRREVVLANAPARAVLNLSARLQYILRVNGRLLGCGPARSYPDFHEFDTHDLGPHLAEGPNIIEAEVLHWNLATFHRLLEDPGFIAGGVIAAGDGTVHDLATPGGWRCRRRRGIDSTAPRLSFAQGPVEIVDLAEDAGRPEEWRTPVDAAPDPTPCLRPRAIPMLTQTPLAPVAVTVSPAGGAEDVAGGRVVLDGTSPVPPGDVFAVMAAWIRCERPRELAAGAWWGEHFLNGTPLAAAEDRSLPLRKTVLLPLRAGWNKLVIAQRLAFGYAEFCLALPRDAGIVLRPGPTEQSDAAFLLAGPLAGEDFRRLRASLTAAGEPLPDIGWRTVPADTVHCSPLRHLAWSRATRTPLAARLPLTIAPGTTALVALDMGRTVLGRFRFDIDAPAGTVLDVAHAEEREEGRARIGKAVVVYGADRWRLPGGRQTIETFSPRGFRHLDMLVSGHRGPVTLHAAAAVEQRYPFAFTGAFECSDADFNRLWAYGRRTLELCGEDVFTDCPWRERTLYGGDLLPEMATTVVLSRDLRLVRQSLEVLLQSADEEGRLQSRAPAPRGTADALADYPLLTSVAAAWYLRLTGDDDFARRAWPVFAAMAAAVARRRRPDGIYCSPGAFIDHGRTTTAGPLCALNAALVAAFRAWAETARRVVGEETAAEIARRGDELDTLVTGCFYDEAGGTFRDLPLADGGRETEGTPANTWPLVFCRSAQARAPAVLAAIARTLADYSPDNESRSVSPYQMFFLLAALRRHGAAGLAEDAIRRVYALMLDRPTGTLWEHSHPGESLAHAWSSAVNDYFATAVLGVRMGFDSPAEPARVIVAPCAATVKWAKGRVPHPLGDVEVAWERRGDDLHVAVAAPEGADVQVTPAGPLARLACHIEG